MRRLHFIVGVVTVFAFFGSGAYMMFAAHPDRLAPGPHLLYLSRHIYMLGPALIHLVLGVYVRPVAGPRLPRLQWAGTTLLVVSSISAILAFVVEPVAGNGRTVVSALAMFTLWAGTLLHLIAVWLARRAVRSRIRARRAARQGRGCITTEAGIAARRRVS